MLSLHFVLGGFVSIEQNHASCSSIFFCHGCWVLNSEFFLLAPGDIWCGQRTGSTDSSHSRDTGWWPLEPHSIWQFQIEIIPFSVWHIIIIMICIMSVVWGRVMLWDWSGCQLHIQIWGMWWKKNMALGSEWNNRNSKRYFQHMTHA